MVTSLPDGDDDDETTFCIKLFTGVFANTAGGGGKVVNNCVGWDIVTPVAAFVTYIGLVAYIVFGRAKSILFCFFFFVYFILFWHPTQSSHEKKRKYDKKLESI